MYQMFLNWKESDGMNTRRREKPLDSFENICRRNGIYFDGSQSYVPVKIVSDDNADVLFDRTFNLFQDKYKVMMRSCQICVKESGSYDGRSANTGFDSAKLVCTSSSAFLFSSFIKKEEVDYHVKMNSPDDMNIAVIAA